MLKDNVIYERLKQNKVFLTEEEVIQVTQSAFEPQSSAPYYRLVVIYGAKTAYLVIMGVRNKLGFLFYKVHLSPAY